MSATFSKDRRYRYTLWRYWDEKGPTVCFIGLNPSTADETKDDPTIRRCVGFAKRWGFGRLLMLNLFAYSATDPLALRLVDDPEGLPDNDREIFSVVSDDIQCIAAWGVHGAYRGRGEAVRRRFTYSIKPLRHLGLTKDGHPKHPLYLRADTEHTIWRST